MKTIDNDIKNGQLKHIYLLYGEERYLIRQYRDKLKRAIVDPDDTMNIASYEGADVDVKDLIIAADTMPFFAERRLILVQDSKLFKKNTDVLAEYFENIPETTYFVFVEDEVEEKTKIFKAASKHGSTVNFTTPKEEILRRWIIGRIAKEGKDITQAAYQSFIDKTGTDMENIEKELEKLICYTMDKKAIEAADVEAVTTEQISSKIYELVNVISNHQQKQALDMFYDLLSQKEKPSRILYSLTKHFDTLLAIKIMGGQGFNVKEMEKRIGLRDWMIRKYQGQTRAFSIEVLKKAVQDGVDYEAAIKTGHMEEQMAVELFIIQYSKKEVNPKP